MPNKTVRGILFDLDHTLYDYPVCNAAGKRAVLNWLSKKLDQSYAKLETIYTDSRSQINKRLSGQAASHARILYLQLLIETVCGHTEPKLTLQAEKIFWTTYYRHMQLRPGLLNLLRDLKAKSVRLAIITDLTTSVQLSKISTLKLDRYFDYVVTSEEAGREKPHTAMIKLALQKLKLHASEVIIIGDSIEKDQAVAKRSHIPFFHVQTNADVNKVAQALRAQQVI